MSKNYATSQLDDLILSTDLDESTKLRLMDCVSKLQSTIEILKGLK